MAHQHGHQGGGNKPAHHYDCGGLFGYGDEKGIEVAREDDRRGQASPASAFAILTGIKGQSELSGTSTLTGRGICTMDADCPAP
jgi:hypothetical protein